MRECCENWREQKLRKYTVVKPGRLTSFDDIPLKFCPECGVKIEMSTRCKCGGDVSLIAPLLSFKKTAQFPLGTTLHLHDLYQCDQCKTVTRRDLP